MKIILSSVAIALAFASFAPASVVLQDDFTGASLDATKWNTANSTAVFDAANDAVSDGWLITKDEYQGTATNLLKVSGTYTAISANYLIDIYLRGVNTIASGQIDGGLRLEHWNNSSGNVLTMLDNPVGGGNNWTAVAPDSSDPWTTDALAAYDFVITDDGTTVTFTTVQQGVPSNDASATWTTSSTFGANYISFLPDGSGTDKIRLNSVTIEIISAIPEPSSLATLGLLSLGMIRRRRRG